MQVADNDCSHFMQGEGLDPPSIFFCAGQRKSDFFAGMVDTTW
jgi:hypothetical protein